MAIQTNPPHAVADDDGRAVFQGPHGGLDLGLHAAGSHIGLDPEGDLVQVVRNERVNDPSAFVAGRTVVDAVDVGHQDGQVGADLHRDPGGEAGNGQQRLNSPAAVAHINSH